MNTLPRLLDNLSWATIASLSANELIELAMFAVLSLGLVAAVCYGIYAGITRRDRQH